MDAEPIPASDNLHGFPRELRLGFRAFWLFAGLALLLSIGYKHLTDVRPLTSLPPSSSEPASGGFVSGGVFPTTLKLDRLRKLQNWGSYLGSDAWQGRHATTWRRYPNGTFLILVAGYPTTPGCSLTAEFRTESGAALPSVVYDQPNPKETWQEWRVNPPPGLPR